MGIYSERPKTDILFAIVLWLFDLICLYIMGAHSDNSWIYWSLGLLPTIIVTIAVIAHDNSLEPLGFCKTNLKTDFLLMIGLLIIEFQIGVILYGMTYEYALKSILYYFFWIALQEEILYRGFLQGYLFSITKSRIVAYCIGAVLFSVSHIPYQVQIGHTDSLLLVKIAITFITHIVFCIIVEKRQNICIPIAIHVAQNFLSVI